MPGILVVCDQPVLMQGLSHVLTGGGFEIAAENGRPDLILFDITAGLTIRDLTDLHARMPQCPVVLWCDARPIDSMPRTMKLAVRAIVPRTSRGDALCRTLRKVFEPGQHALRAERQPALTPRERELVRGLREGLRNRQIAAEMNITEGTVKIYLFRLYHKMGVRTRLEMVRCARDQAVH